MKKILLKHTLLMVILLATSCAKEKGSNGNCKTCRALGGPDQQTITRELCSEQEEQSFRSQYAGREITCN